MASKLYQDRRGGAVVVASAVTSLAFPPVEVGDVSGWNGSAGVLPQFDIEVWAAGAVDITDAELLGVNQIDVTIASDDVDTVDFANDELDITTHGLATGHGPIRLSTTDTLPTGLALETDYWVIEVNSGTIQLATSLENAIEGTAVSFSDVGAGTHSIIGAGASGAAYAIRYMNYGYLGPNNDGAISLSAVEGYTTRINHRPRTVAYGVKATLSSAVATTVTLHPVQVYT